MFCRYCYEKYKKRKPKSSKKCLLKCLVKRRIYEKNEKASNKKYLVNELWTDWQKNHTKLNKPTKIKIRHCK